MVIPRCATCKKNITRKASGIVCSRCDKNVHATHECAKLSNKQLATLRNTPGLEWSCAECINNASRRSFITADDSDEEPEEEEEPTKGVNTSKLIRDITSEMKKILKVEFGEFKREFEASLAFISEQVSSLEEELKGQDLKIKSLENKNTELQNKNKNLELRVTCLEQLTQEMEQKSLLTYVEISGLPEATVQNPQATIKSLATKLKVEASDVISTRSLTHHKDKPRALLVELRSMESRNLWISAAKQLTPTVGEIMQNALHGESKNPIYIREALTANNKMLLYNAKKLLRNTYEFVWCKNGKVFARKTKVSKVHIIRSQGDIEVLVKK